MQTFAAWDLKLRTNVNLRTFESFIDSTRPNLEEVKRITRISGDVRLADIQASIDLWDKHNDSFLFTVLLNSTILSRRQNKHVLERYLKKKEGHNLYVYLTSHLTAEKTSTKLKSKDELDAILIPADASAEMLKKSLEDIEDLWPKVEGLVQTQKAIILQCISLFPEEHCTCKYLTNLDASVCNRCRNQRFLQRLNSSLIKLLNLLPSNIVDIRRLWGLPPSRSFPVILEGKAVVEVVAAIVVVVAEATWKRSAADAI